MFNCQTCNKKESPMAPKYKLTYFNIRARAEMTRLLFAAANVPYEDVRFEFKDWPELKPSKLFESISLRL